MEEQKIREFYQNWQERLPQLVEGYIYDEDKKILPTRYIFSRFKKVLGRFLLNELEEHEKIIILPGIRGVGKTTLLMQILKVEKFLQSSDSILLENLGQIEERLYLDVSKLKLVGISLNDFFNFYERIKGFKFESLLKKIVIFLDEVHYDEDWGLFLKNIFDRTKGHRNILVIATGSSAINLRMNPDLSRRAMVEEIFPLKFNEYLILKYGKYTIDNLSSELQETIFNSAAAGDVYRGLKDKQLELERFFAELSPNTEQEFFETGGFPFTIRIANKIKALELVKNVINSVIIKDVVTLKTFKTGTINKISSLLYLLANSEKISYEKLQKSLRIPEFRTIESLIDVLIISGMLVKIPSYGKTYGPTRKTPKLLFVSPTLRGAILDNNFLASFEGAKLEDYYALIYKKNLKDKLSVNLAYDIAEGGADFVLTMKDRNEIVIEVGFNKEDINQVINTQKKVNGKYGIVFGSKNLELINNTIVKIPLEYFLLI